MGMFAGSMAGGFSLPEYNESKGFVVGAAAGVGVGTWGTNATCGSQLAGPFNTVSVNTPWFSLQFSFDNAWAHGDPGGVFVFLATLGKSAGASVSAYPTQTKVFFTWP
jgi:hypothetical protein